MRPADGISVSVLVEVDPATAFEVFTEDVDGWWKRGPAYRFRAGRAGTMRFEPGVGGRLIEVFDAEGDVYEVGRILVWSPAQRLVFEWRGPNFEPDQSTAVEVTFEQVARGTRVTVEHNGWYGLPQDHPVRHGLGDEAFAQMIGGWWSQQIRSMRTHAERRSSREEDELSGSI